MKLELLKFSSEFCGPCKAVSILLKKYDFSIREIDVVEDYESALEYKVSSIPTLIVMKEGKEISRLIGGQITKKELDKIKE